MSGIAFLRRLLMKEAMKKSKDASGIMSLNKGLMDDVDIIVKKWVESAKKQGQDIDKMGGEEIKYIVEMNKPKGPTLFGHRVIDATSAEGKGITDQLTKQLERLKPKESADVLDLSGKKIDTSKPILGGKNVPEGEGFSMTIAEGPQTGKKITMDEFFEMTGATNKSKIDVVADTVTRIISMQPVAALKEANLVIGRKGKYKNLTKKQSQKILKDTDDWIFQRDPDDLYDYNKKRPFRDDADPEDLAHGGRTGTGLNYLLGEDDQNVRVPFVKGKLADAGRRWFLELMGGAAAAGAAAKTGVLGLLKGGGKKEVVETLTQVPIKAGVDGMPAWVKPLINKVIKEGEEYAGSLERVIGHKTTLPKSKTPISVEQDLNTGHVIVDIGQGKHGWADGHLGQPVRLEYKASELIEPPIVKEGKIAGHGKGTKTKEEFWVEEAEFTGGHPENVKFEESSFNKFGEHGSNFDEVEKFATGTVKKTKPSIKAERSHWVPEGDDMASGGRVPLGGGGPSMHGNYSVDEILEFKKMLIDNGYSPGDANDYVRWLLRKNKMLEFPSVGFSSGGLAGMLGE